MNTQVRYPAVPLIAVDPYFSVWSMADKLTTDTKHWTGAPHRLCGSLTVDGVSYGFMGSTDHPMEQESCLVTALSSLYTFSCAAVRLQATFTTPLLLDDLMLTSRPVSYLSLQVRSIDGKEHACTLEITADDELCLNKKGEFDTVFSDCSNDAMVCAKVGSATQPVLGACGDDLRINWGYFYLATDWQNAKICATPSRNENGTAANNLKLTLPLHTGDTALVAFAYDDVHALTYFGQPVDAYWKKDGARIESVIADALHDYPAILARCTAFSQDLQQQAFASGGEPYVNLLNLAYRQSIAAHKLCLDENGELLFVSKECFSNGCAATVDVSYPSIPLYLLYNPELIKAMMRPIFRYAATDTWCFDFAPHDCGTYPILNGQVYSNGTDLEWQMPVEECGNMLVMTAATALAQAKTLGAQEATLFAKEHWNTLEKWCGFLIQQGMDPDNQLCTDDFAGHLNHNCNLSLKAIMGIAGFSLLNRLSGDSDTADILLSTAQSMADQWCIMAKNDDHTFRLAFDQPDTFSLKYNAVWDQIFDTHLFPADQIEGELQSYLTRQNRYGMPLDNRAAYTKSDWLVWAASMFERDSDFVKMITPLWESYQNSESRVPLTDWYDTTIGKMVGFQNRSVQGGLFMKLVKASGVETASRA